MNQGYFRGYNDGVAGKEQNCLYPSWCAEARAYLRGWRDGDIDRQNTSQEEEKPSNGT